MTIEKGFVSVIIPTYNRGIKIKRTIEAIECNNFPKDKFEIIVVDDFSDQDPRRIIENLNDKYKNIKFLRNNVNLGPSATRNNGVKKSKGEFLFFTDDDCIVPENWIKYFLDFFNSHKDVVCVGGCAKPSSNNFVARIDNVKDNLLKIRVKEPMIGGREVPTGFTGNTAYRRNVFEGVGGFDESVIRQEDIFLKNKVAEKYKVAALPILVIHEHDFNFDYFLSRIIKEGLEKLPPKKRTSMVFMIVVNIPFLIYNVVTKIIKYRKRKM